MKSLKNKILTILIAAAFFLIALSSCSSDDPVKIRNSAITHLYNRGSVKFVAANSFELNKSLMWEGLLLAKEKIEKENLCPVNIDLVKVEDSGDPITALSVAHQIASDKEVSVIIGHGYSDITLPCSLIYQFYGILTFNFISTTDTLADRTNPLFISNIPNDMVFGREIANLCSQNGYKNPIIYYLDNNPGVSISNSFELYCNKLGISIVSRESFDLNTDSMEFDRIIRRWKNNFAFDSIFITGRMPIIKDIIDSIRKNDINCPIIGSEAFDDPLLTNALNEEEDGKIFTVSNYNTESTNPAFIEFYESFKQKFNREPDQEALQAYDALIVIAKGIQMADSALPSDIVNTLKNKTFSEAAGPYTLSKDGKISGRKLTDKVFEKGEFVNLH